MAVDKHGGSLDGQFFGIKLDGIGIFIEADPA